MNIGSSVFRIFRGISAHDWCVWLLVHRMMVHNSVHKTNNCTKGTIYQKSINKTTYSTQERPWGCFERPWNQAYLLKPYSTCSRTWEGKKCASTYINCQHVIFYILSVNTQLKQCSLMICSLDSTRSWITLQILNNFSHIFTYRVPNISIVSLVQFSFKNESSSRHMALLWACKKNTLLPKKRELWGVRVFLVFLVVTLVGLALKSTSPSQCMVGWSPRAWMLLWPPTLGL